MKSVVIALFFTFSSILSATLEEIFSSAMIDIFPEESDRMLAIRRLEEMAKQYLEDTEMSVIPFEFSDRSESWKKIYIQTAILYDLNDYGELYTLYRREMSVGPLHLGAALSLPASFFSIYLCWRTLTSPISSEYLSASDRQILYAGIYVPSALATYCVKKTFQLCTEFANLCEDGCNRLKRTISTVCGSHLYYPFPELEPVEQALFQVP